MRVRSMMNDTQLRAAPKIGKCAGAAQKANLQRRELLILLGARELPRGDGEKLHRSRRLRR